MTQLRGLLFLSLSIIYLIYSFTDWVSEWVVVVLMAISFFFSLPYMAFLPRIMAIVMICAGHFFYFWYEGNLAYWKDSVMTNLPMLVLFVSVPLLSIPLRAGGYIDLILKFMHRFLKSKVSTYVFASMTSFILTAFMNMGSIRVTAEIFAQELQKNKEMFVKSITQGFAVAACFSPYIAGVAMVLYLLDISLMPFLGLGLFFAFISLMFSAGLTYLKNNGELIDAEDEEVATQETESERVSLFKLFQLIIAFIGLFASIIILENNLEINFVLVISLVAIAFPMIWMIFIKQYRTLPSHLTYYWKELLPYVHNESFMLISAAFFSQMIQLSPASQILQSVFRLLDSLPTFLIVLFILFLVVGISLIGVHQVLPITILAVSISPESLEIEPLLYAFVLTVGWGTVALLAPISALNIVVSQLFHVSPWQLGKWNWKLGFFMIILAAIFVDVLNRA